MSTNSKVGILILSALIVLGVVGAVFFNNKKPTEQQAANPTTQNSQDTQPLTLEQKLLACESIPNGSITEVKETERIFINLPEDIYPVGSRKFSSKGAEAGSVSNGEGLGPVSGSEEAFAASKCATHSYEFNGSGTVDLTVKSADAAFPDYQIHFRVSK